MRPDEPEQTLGEIMGTQFALYENDLIEDPGNDGAWARIGELSAIYKNFSIGHLPNFQEDFQRGYEIGKGDVAGNAAPGPDKDLSNQFDASPNS